MATKEGKETTEFQVAKSGSKWGIIASVIGLITAAASGISASYGNDSTIGLISAAVVVVAGVVQKLLTDLSYIKSRTKVKTETKEDK